MTLRGGGLRGCRPSRATVLSRAHKSLLVVWVWARIAAARGVSVYD